MPTYRVDPVSGNDANDGSSWALAFKTLKKTFAAGDEILVAKSVETPLAGTVSAEQGSVTVSTTDDLTGSLAQYSIIRINSTQTLYMVRSITSAAITLYRPYRGTTGSGYGINVLTVPVVASGDFTPTAGNGTLGSPITLTTGVNPLDDEQDGFTVVNVNNGSYGFSSNVDRSYWDVSRLGFYYCSYPWIYTRDKSDCNFTDCFSFRCGAGNEGAYLRCTLTRPIYEVAGITSTYYTKVTFEDPEVAEVGSGFYLSRNAHSIVVNNLRVCRASASGIGFSGIHHDIRFVSPIVNELNEAVPAVYVGSNGSSIDNVVIDNLKRGSGGGAIVNFTYAFIGSIALTNMEGVAGADQLYLGRNDGNNHYYLMEKDETVYRTATPSARITGINVTLPISVFHYIPCAAGVEKTISVWFRKSSSPAYGSLNRPTMRLRWHTGTSPDIVPNVYDVVMPDTDDEFVQVSHTITPSIAEGVVMELIFSPGTNGAIAWYDDIEVA